MAPKPKKKKPFKIKKQHIWLVLAGGGALAVAAFFYLGDAPERLTASGHKLVHTMDPSYFSKDPKAQSAYQVAKDIPEVLAEMPCFCGCMMALGHESNLFCFRDEHGSGCNICEDVALQARDLHKQGLSIDQIQERVRESFSHVQ
jgi:hypothetical protein